MKDLSKVKKSCGLAAGILMIITFVIVFIDAILQLASLVDYSGYSNSLLISNFILCLFMSCIFLVAGIFSIISVKQENKIFAIVSLILMAVLFFASSFRISAVNDDASLAMYIIYTMFFFVDVVLSIVTVVMYKLDEKNLAQKNEKTGLDKNIELIAKYKSMFDEGLLTAEEFETYKHKVLDKTNE